MKKGLTQTLMAVAVVTMAIRVMALAPTVLDIPSPIVGDAEDITPANNFVFPDAIDLTQYVSDDNITAGAIIWSFETVGASKYLINGADTLASGDDPIQPPAAKLVAGTDSLGSAADSDPAKVDANAYTITLRNKALSPVGGPNVAPPAAGVVDTETQAITFWASDGTSATASQPVYFYTVAGQNDAMSPVGGTNVIPGLPSTGVNAWSSNFAGSVTTSAYNATNGYCLTTIAGGDNIGIWSLPYGSLPLVKNSVYRIRLTLNGSQSTPNTCPFWDLIVNNYGYNASQVLHGMNLYGSNYMVWDQTGDANAIFSTTPNKVMDVWWCPPPVQTARWNDESETQPGPFAPSNSGDKDAFIEFRILDNVSGGYGAESDLGTLCLKNLVVDRYDFASIALDNSVTPYAPAITSGGKNGVSISGGNTRGTEDQCTITIASGTVTLTPTTAGATRCLGQVEPGDFTYDYGNQASLLDNYPMPMVPHALYLISMDLSAPATADQNAPPDIYWIGADTLTNELINLSYVTNGGWHHGMPTTTAATYYALFSSNYATLTTGTGANPTWFSQFRPRFMFGNNAILGGGGEPDTGALRINTIRVDKITIPGGTN